MTYQYNKTWKQLLAGARAKQLAVTVGKVAAVSGTAVGGLSLGLHEVKRSLKATEKQDLWKIASYDLRHSAEAGAEARNSRRKELVRRITGSGDLDLQLFQDAARRLRPVELQLEEFGETSLEARPTKATSSSRRFETSRHELTHEEKSLVESWSKRGYLNPGAGAANIIFGRRLTSDAQGMDVGVQVPTYLMPEDGVPSVGTPAWLKEEREGAVSALERWGCVSLRNAISSDDLASLQEAFGLGVGSSARRAQEVGLLLQSHDPNIAMGRYTFGRLHCLLRGSPTFEPLALAIHPALAPLVHAYFRKSEEAGDRAFLSEAQLIITDPCAEQQQWYINKVGGPGLTFIIPLQRVRAEQGAHTILPGTHALQDTTLPIRERLRKCFSALCATHGSVSVVDEALGADWNAGDVLVLDGRVMNRALANESFGAPFPMLVLRYDAVESPPPGCGRWWLLYQTMLGVTLDRIFQLYSVV